jgi:D-alanyl-D-alanine carboxypeptidase/D-alanyl-D-alanine-endopeptidase (penicillin-binding protein 4)
VGDMRLRPNRRSVFMVTVVLTAVVAFVGAGAAVVATGVVKVGWAGPRATALTPSSTPPAGTPVARSASPSTPRVAPSSDPRSRATRQPAGPVLASIDADASAPTTEGLTRALAGVVGSPALGAHVSVAVRDLGTGKLLYGKNSAAAFIPASTTKILTGAAVLAALGPDHRFETKVVAGSKPGQIVLVGGGDPLLSTMGAVERRTGAARYYPVPASIEDLAERTAKKLKTSKQTSVLVDDSLFAQTVSPTWESQYVPTGVVAPISALWVDEGRDNWPAKLPRAKDPAMTAAARFVEALEHYGIEVTGTPNRGKAPADAAAVASVRSPTLADLVEHVLLISDNDGAEVLARHVAVAEGKPATFAGAAAAIKAVLARLGVEDAAHIDLHDGSGLSRDGRLSADVLTQVIAAAARPEFPDLRAALTGLPVAGYTGSLEARFYDDPSAPGVGIVRAKTGTLTGVQSLAGVATTKDGAALAFAVMTDKAKQRDPRPVIDQVAAVLATCGCR